jgi:hypothetical protein
VSLGGSQNRNNRPEVNDSPDPSAIAREVLEYLLLRLRDADPREVNLAPPEYHSAAGALFALDRVGLVENEEGWRERFREATGLFREKVVENEKAHPRPAHPVTLPPLSPATLDEALSHVERMIDLDRQAAERLGREYQELPSHSGALMLLRTLDAMDLLREEDWRRWTTRFERAARAELTPTVTHDAHALAAAHVRLERAAPIDPSRHPPLVHPIPQCTQAEFVDLLIVDAPDDATARPMTLERFRDGVVLTWTAVFEPGTRHSAPRSPRVALADDVGTHYFPSGAGGGGGGPGPVRIRWNQSFAPAIPPEARILRLTIDDEGFDLALPD